MLAVRGGCKELATDSTQHVCCKDSRPGNEVGSYCAQRSDGIGSKRLQEKLLLES